MALNTPHKVTLTEGQFSTILFVLEGYINPSEILAYDPECREDIDTIFEVLEGAVDKYYNKLEAAKEKQPKAEW